MSRKTPAQKRADRWRLLHQLANRRLAELTTDAEFHILEASIDPLDDELVERLYPDQNPDAGDFFHQPNSMPIDHDLDSADWYDLHGWQ